jgi:hypothetical protein
MSLRRSAELFAAAGYDEAFFLRWPSLDADPGLVQAWRGHSVLHLVRALKGTQSCIFSTP